MWIFVAEALGALGLLLFIVWWTLGPTHRRERDALRRLADDEAARRASSTESSVESSAQAADADRAEARTARTRR